MKIVQHKTRWKRPADRQPRALRFDANAAIDAAHRQEKEGR
jgi:hypothetical protein